MTINPITTLFALLLCCLLGSCGTVNTTSTRTTPALDEVPDARLQVNDLLTEIFLHCRGVRLYRSQPSNLLEAQIVVANDGFTTRTFAGICDGSIRPAISSIPRRMSGEPRACQLAAASR